MKTALCVWHHVCTLPPCLSVWYHIPSPWHGTLSLHPCHCSPPPLGGGFCHAAPQHRPFFFVSLRFSLACRQCPFLGTTFWKGRNARTYVFSLTFVPLTPPIIVDQCQLGIFFFFYFYLILCLLSTHLNEMSTNIRQAAFHLSEVTVNDWVSGFIVFASR